MNQVLRRRSRSAATAVAERHRPLPSGLAHGCAVLLLIASSTAAAAPISEITIGGAATRGYFDWAITGGWAPLLFERSRSTGASSSIDFPFRIDGLFSTRGNLTNLVAGLMPTVRWQPPGFEGNDFAPFLATGPGLHFQGTWSSLRQFGGVEVQTETTLKWHAFLGASLARGERAEFLVESRYTAPSDLVFDYIVFAVRIHSGRP